MKEAPYLVFFFSSQESSLIKKKQFIIERNNNRKSNNTNTSFSESSSLEFRNRCFDTSLTVFGKDDTPKDQCSIFNLGTSYYSKQILR